MIRVTVNNRGVQAIPLSPVTVGSEGIVCAFLFSDDWAGLAKTAIFKGSGEEVEQIVLNNQCTVPPEVLTEAGGMLQVGVYGNDGHGTTIRPTIWGVVGRIEDSAISEDAGQTGTTPSWAAQLQIAVQDVLTSEAARVAAEDAREDAEEDRVDAEEARVTAEAARVAAETARASAETSRASAETARASAESSRASAESARATAETARASAEEERAAAEAIREANYATYVETVSGYADAASTSAYNASVSASAASTYAGQAASSASSAAGNASAASSSATSAAGYATTAGTHAGTATTKAQEAAASASAASDSATTATSAKNAAATAQGAAEAAQAAAEEAQEAIEDAAAQIAQNTQDIADLEDEKQDKPETAGTAGQVLGLDANLNPVWVDQTSGGVSSVNGKTGAVTLDAGDIEFDDSETYAAGSIGAEVSNQKNAIDQKAPLIINTASGDIATFADGADDMPFKKIVGTIVPQQDLHGYDAPWPAGGGKNLVEPYDNNLPYSQGGVTITKDGNGYKVVASGATGYPYVRVGTIHGLKAGTYSCSWTQGLPTGIGWRVIDRNVSPVKIYNQTQTFTVAEDVAHDIVVELTIDGANVADGTYSNILFQIEAGTAPTEWAPYSNICPISGWTGCNVTRTGKNLLPTQLITKNGSTYYIGDGNTWIPFKAGTYTASNVGTASYMYWRKKGTSDNNIIHKLTRSGSFTLVEDCEIRFWFYSTDASPSFTDIQIELGSTATAYEEYQGQTISVSWATEAGTVYGGTLDLVTGELTVDKVLRTLNGTEAWRLHDIIASWFYVDNILPNAFINATASDFAISDKYVQYRYSDVTSIPNNSFAVGSSNLRLVIKDTRYTTVEEWQTALGTNNLQIVYTLATPQTYHLDPVTVNTLLGNNTVYVDCGSVTVDYPADTKLYVDGLTAPDEDMIADANIASGKYFVVNNQLYLSTAAIAAGASIVPGTNCTATNLAEALNALNT